MCHALPAKNYTEWIGANTMATRPPSIREWAATAPGKTGTWTLPIRGDGNSATQAWMIDRKLNVPTAPTTAGDTARTVTAVSPSGDHTTAVAFMETTAVVVVDDRDPFAITGSRGFGAAIPVTTEGAVAINDDGDTLVVQVVHIDGRPGAQLNRWFIRAGTTEAPRLAPMSMGRDVHVIPGSLAAVPIDAYMAVDAAAEHSRPKWCVTWAAWSETVTNVGGSRANRICSRITSASVCGTYLHADGVTLASMDDPFVSSAPISSSVSDWNASVRFIASKPHTGPQTLLPVTTLWCPDVILTAWPSKTFPGFKDSTRIAAAPWSPDAKAKINVETPVAGMCTPFLEQRPGETDTYVFICRASTRPATLVAVLFESDWPCSSGAAGVLKPIATIEDHKDIQAAAGRLGLPWVAVLGLRPGERAIDVDVAVMRSRPSGDLRWEVVSKPIGK